MPESTKPKPNSALIHRTTLAAITLKQLGEIYSTPYVKVVAGTSLLIVETFQNVRSNKQECVALLEEMSMILHILIQFCSGNSASISPDMLEAVAQLAETLQKIESFMRMQQNKGRIKRFFKQQETATQLEGCKRGLSDAMTVFSTSMITVAGDVAEMQASAEMKHQELLQLISERYSSDRTSSLASDSTISGQSMNSRLSLLSMLPAAPQIFHGREAETTAIVESFIKDPARIAILGPGGIGKTSLAKFILHHPTIAERFPDRYYVSCDSASTVDDLALAAASSMNLGFKSQASKAIIKHLSSKPSTLLVFDNFETPWEPEHSRHQVEEFLASVASITNVGLLVTMRGQERPLKVQWTRPFIPPLEPLSADAAYQTFLAISDAGREEDTHVAQLLSLTGNLPLAVTLMATVASFEGCDYVLSRWKIENVSLLSDGFDKGMSLETSVRISLSSPRMVSSPGALQLLSVLSLLPDGISEEELVNSSCPITEVFSSKSTLLRTSLAYVDAGKLKVLAPVRDSELIRQLHPPPYTLIRPLRIYLGSLNRLWRRYEMPSGDLVRRLMGHTGNLSSILQYSLNGCVGREELKQVVNEIFHLNSLISRSLGYRPVLMDSIETYLERVDDSQLRADYIFHLFNARKGDYGSEVFNLIAEGCKWYRRAGDLSGESRLHEAMSTYFIQRNDIANAFISAEKSLALSEQANDDLRQHRALGKLAECNIARGNYRAALACARKAQWRAGRLGNFQCETRAMVHEATAWMYLGDLTRAVQLCTLAHQLVVAAGLEQTMQDLGGLDLEAEVYTMKTAYLDGRRIHDLIVQYTSPGKHELYHGNSLVAMAAIDVTLGAFKNEVETAMALEVPRQIFKASRYLRGLPLCDAVEAHFLLSTGRVREAVKIYEDVVHSFRGEEAEGFSRCLAKLGDLTLRPEEVSSVTRWATTYLAFGKTTGNIPAVSWALRQLGDIFQAHGDEKSASSLFAVALEEFTRMDIHRGRAECLVRIAKLSKGHGESAMGEEQLQEARRMFLKSGMVSEAERLESESAEQYGSGMKTSDERPLLVQLA